VAKLDKAKGAGRMKVLVTGGAGFIGSHVVDAYVAAGHDVVVVDDLSTGSRRNLHPAARLYEADIRSPEVAGIFVAERPDVLNHHAAQAAVRRSVEDPVLDASVNLLGTLNLLACCRQYGVRRVIYASSGGAGYGDTDIVPTPEDHPDLPVSPYGVSKVTVERYLACWEALYGMRSVTLRYANVYGPRQNPHGEAGVVAIFTTRLLQGLPAVINGDGLQTRDYVYVGDVAAANLMALERPEVSGAFNIGTGAETSVVALFERLRAVLGLSVLAEHGPAKSGEQRRSVLDVGLAKRVLGWAPRHDLDEGLARTVESFRQLA
jgi:UDP-glucose 4-epimerase